MKELDADVSVYLSRINMDLSHHPFEENVIVPFSRILSYVLQAAGNRPAGHVVEVLYNGVRVALPGCRSSEGLCTLEAFLVRSVRVDLRHKVIYKPI